MFYHPEEDSPTERPLSRSITLPAVYEVLIEYTDYYPECACSPETELDHGSPRLKLVEIEHRDRFCPLAVTALTPTVEQLTLLVTNIECVSAYIEDVKHRKLHPNLQVTVNYYDTTAELTEAGIDQRRRRALALQPVWSTALGVPFVVTAELYPRNADPW